MKASAPTKYLVWTVTPSAYENSPLTVLAFDAYGAALDFANNALGPKNPEPDVIVNSVLVKPVSDQVGQPTSWFRVVRTGWSIERVE